MRNKIMLIGEAYGAEEEKVNKPFVGMAGRVLDGILDEVGLSRNNITITNVINRRPPNNNFEVFYEKDSHGRKVPGPELLRAYERLKGEIVSHRPNVIVPMGAEALKALTDKDSIMHWRGSVLDSPLGKIIPTIHPAAIAREWSYRPAVVCDFHKIAKESEYAEIRKKERTLVVNPTFEEIRRELHRLMESDWVSFDIETESNQITCIGLSDRPDWAICIPFWFGSSGSYWSLEQESEIWGWLRRLLESEYPKKVAHNGAYDIEFIERTTGIRSRIDFDTMLGFHVLYPELPKGLAYLVSIYTDHPYYKHEIKSQNSEDYFRYNATDAALTFECFGAIRMELNDAKLDNFYQDYVHSLIRPLLSMQHRGVSFNSELRNTTRKQYRYDISQLNHALERLVGHPLNVASSPQMKKWLYEELALPQRFKLRKTTGETTLSADDEALNALYKQTQNPAINLVLQIREKQKILGTYLEVKVDKDERIRCSYNISGTETGRLSSSATAQGTGTNLQNIPRGIVKKLFRADVHKVLVNADLSQAEARVVAYLANEERLIRVFESGGDIHRKNASNIFRVKEEEVTNAQRETAKRVVHASNYGMGPRTFATTAGISEGEAKRLLNLYFATYPRIRVWHMSIRDTLQSTRELTTPFGRRRTFFNKWNDSLLKEGLAFIPQSTVADMVNQALIQMDREGFELLLQVHDSIVFQCTPKELDEKVARARVLMERPVEINGKILRIPMDVKVGENWEEMKKYCAPHTSPDLNIVSHS
jgi:DNA polymerase I